METTREIHSFCRKTPVLMLLVHATAAYIQSALDVGATGNVLKDDVPIDLLVAIRAVARDSRYFSHKFASIAQKYLVGGRNLRWQARD